MSTESLAPAETKALSKVLDELDYYQLLEIPREASSMELKSAYYASSRRFHPDANRHRDRELRGAVDRIAKRVTEAYSVLRDPRRRKAYDRKLEATQGAPRIQLAEAEAAAGKAESAESGSTPNGRRFFMDATRSRRQGDLAAATRSLQMALTFEPQNEHFKRTLEEIRKG